MAGEAPRRRAQDARVLSGPSRTLAFPRESGPDSIRWIPDRVKKTRQKQMRCRELINALADGGGIIASQNYSPVLACPDGIAV